MEVGGAIGKQRGAPEERRHSLPFVNHARKTGFKVKRALPLAMRGILASALAGAFFVMATPALADAAEFEMPGQGEELPPYLQCVPYARQVSGIQIYGDAHTWWQQAAGKYARGNAPRVGAVMAFRPHRNMRLGHVAAVSRVIDSRTVLLRHANWSPINGRRGQIENDVMAVDASLNNDWSEVKVWYAPIGAIGTTAWPVEGFIYPERGKGRMPSTATTVLAVAQPAPVPRDPSRKFLSAFADLGNPVTATPAKLERPVRQSRRAAAALTPRRVAAASTPRTDPIGAAIARYE